ncbi:MAG TPA: HYR domain-containing protein, partial [Acidimicrobiia bacterium]
VPDSKKPVITTPLGDLTLEATGPQGAVATYSASATDDKDGAVPVVFTPPSGSVFPVGTTVVVANASDFAGNTASEFFHVTVQDTTPPVLSLPGEVVAEATGPDGAAVMLSASAEDIVGGALPVTFSPASGSTFPLGTTTVAASATDAAGNTATATFDVVVRDTTAAALRSLGASPSVLWPPNHRMVPVTVTADVQDAVGVAATRIVSVASSEAPDGKGGKTGPDWQVTGDMTLLLRAQRDGGGSGHVYTITVESRDAAGNVATAAVNVLVPHDQGKR